MTIQRSHKVILYTIFAASGFCALIYEILWTKYLALTFGNTMLAVSTVAATFMGGLAIGSFLMGKYADREKNLLFLYVVLEIGIAVSALLFSPALSLVTEVHSALERMLPAHPAGTTFVHFLFSALLLLPPTICMGGTFPVMCRLFVQKKICREIGRLYALNTIGATFGAFCAGYFLIPTLGLPNTGYLGVFLNLAIAATAFVFARNEPGAINPDPAGRSEQKQSLELKSGRFLLVSIQLIGAFALAYEVLWTRVFLLFLGNTTYAFAIILSVYLVGVALGGALYARQVREQTNLKKVFAVQTSLMGLAVLLTVPFYDRLAFLFQWAHEVSGENWWLLSLISLGLVFLVIIVPTLLSGSLLPAAVAILSPEHKHTGKGVGLVVHFNTVGAVFGSLLAGFLLIPGLGLQKSFQVLGLLNVLLGLGFFLWYRGSIGRARFIPALAVLGIAFTLFPSSWNQKLMNSAVYCYAPKYAKWGGIEKALQGERILEVIEGIDTTVAVKEYQDGSVRYFSVNGKTDGGTGSDMSTQTLIGQLPLLLHPNPREAMVIGLGTGITLGSVQSHPSLEEIECAEISPGVVEASKYFTRYNDEALRDPRVKLHIEDGRNLLLTWPDKYDVIISEPSNPWQIGNANLFTKDFYDLAATRLEEDGIFCQWLGLYDITPENLRVAAQTFLQTFPYVLAFNSKTDLILIGAQHELKINHRRLSEKMAQPEIRRQLARIGVHSPEQLLAGHFFFSDASLRQLAGNAPLNSDDHPILEYSFKDNLGGKMVFGTLLKKNAQAISSAHTGEVAPLTHLGKSRENIAKTLRKLGRAHQKAGRSREADIFLREARHQMEKVQTSRNDRSVQAENYPNRG